jgi:PAS domain S-box-containing protein
MSHLQRFGQYSMGWRPDQVRDGNRLLKFTSRQFKVLSLLVRARGKVVTKKVFHEKVWTGRFVEEGNLSQAIYLLRRSLGKLPDGKPYIETISGEGYRIPAAAFQENYPAYTSSQETPSLSTSLEGRLKEADQFRLLVESIEEYAIYMLDCAGRFLTWNRGAERNQGYNREEVIGQHYSMLFVPEDIDARVPDHELATAARSGRREGEGWRIRKNGERFWAGYLTTAIRGADKKLLGYSGVVRDLSEHKREEDSLLRMDACIRRERDRLYAAAESSMDALYICEAVRNEENEIEDFVFTYLNSNVEKMVSLPREVMLGGRMCELLPFNRTIGLFEAYKRVVNTGESFVKEFPVRAENIKSGWIRLQAVPLNDGVAITACDITDRVIAERRLNQLLAKTDETVKETINAS